MKTHHPPPPKPYMQFFLFYYLMQIFRELRDKIFVTLVKKTKSLQNNKRQAKYYNE